MHVSVSLSMLAGAPLSSLASPTLAAPGAGRVVAGPQKVPALNIRYRAQQPLFAVGPPPLLIPKKAWRAGIVGVVATGLSSHSH